MSADLRSRVRGAVLGAAIGDAMGHPTEFMSIESILSKHPPSGVTGYALYWERGGQRFAPYTDDTQMAEIVLTTLCESREANWSLEAAMTRVGDRFADWRVNPQGGHRAPGNACMAGAQRLGDGVHWSEAGGPQEGGCGSVMRAYPFGVLFCTQPHEAVTWAVEHSKPTHRAPIAFAACAAIAAGTAALLNGAEVADAVDTMISAAAQYDAGTADMIGAAVRAARAGEDPVNVLRTYQGWAAHEAIAAAAYVVTLHPEDIAAAILQGANSDGDSDSIATLAGALLGARHGIEALPEEWVRDVERSVELLALADRAATIIGA